jgi:hypothetical protein
MLLEHTTRDEPLGFCHRSRGCAAMKGDSGVSDRGARQQDKVDFYRIKT